MAAERYARAECAHGDRVADLWKAVNLRKYMYFGNQNPVASGQLSVVGNSPRRTQSTRRGTG